MNVSEALYGVSIAVTVVAIQPLQLEHYWVESRPSRNTIFTTTTSASNS